MDLGERLGRKRSGVGVEEIGELKDDKMKDSRELKGGDRMESERS